MSQTEATAFLVMSAYARAQELLSSRQQAADPAPSGRTWTRPTLLAICIVQNPYRQIRPSNPEYFRLA